MTIKTLEHIHKLLIMGEADSLSKYQDARERQYEAEGKGEPDAVLLEKQADTLLKIHSEAMKTLKDFENQDWR